MAITALMEKLMQIETALKRGDYIAAHKLVLDAEECTLEVEREMIRMQAERVRRIE